MLTRLTLEHFKCFDTLQLPLAPLTILSGLNASGKSTVLQALSLLHQTIAESDWSTTLVLNGSSVALGAAGDVIDKISGRNEFAIGLSSEKYECKWLMQTASREELAAPVEKIDWREADSWAVDSIQPSQHDERIYRLLPERIWNNSVNAKQLSATLSRLSYVSADRIGPRETYPAATPNQQSSVGPRGEFTPWFLHHFSSFQPLDLLLVEGTPPTLLRQTEAWLQRFFPGASINVDPVRGANLMIMGIRTSEATDFHRPQNVGYGLTHVLPILAACLGAKRQDVLLIENPESHLHPAGQSAMGNFLARAVAAGAQIIIETHSDHVLNGIRRAVKDKLIEASEVALHFFAPRIEQTDQSQVISPIIDQNGTIDHWPAGFFDQYDKDTSALINW